MQRKNDRFIIQNFLAVQILYTVNELKKSVAEIRLKKQSIGFVPTMGALHLGHLSLIRKSKCETDVTICSIFVNPTQFNDSKDFEKYPIKTHEDLSLLQTENCDIVFIPSVNEVYPQKDEHIYDLGGIDKLLEGKFRPGHFNGVASVVKRFFEITTPDKAFFGEKDFQQLLIIKELVHRYKIPVEIIGCPIMRETDGLAMSSRNMRLSKVEREIALQINKILSSIKENYPKKTLSETKLDAIYKISKIPEFKLDYIELVDRGTLEAVTNWSDSSELIVCIAIFIGEVRLIDNMFIN